MLPSCFLSPLLILMVLLLLSTIHHHHWSTEASHSPSTCTVENAICSASDARICRNSSCVSVCSTRGMKQCECDVEEDNYCYLCCGNSYSRCLPAHQYNILRDNGERWEREACALCRQNGAELEGLACDDMDPARLCLQGKCSNSVCHDKKPGQYCDRKMEKICVDDICENPCARISPHLMVCDCPLIDPDTGFASDDRCQLCCYDFNVKPASRRCQNAYRRFNLASTHNRPIWRVGLDCAGGKKCNRYGVCRGLSLQPTFYLILSSALFFICCLIL
uniref:Uncharacterized protein n=1 Tax=Onchocerca volvulus TaxID=6282 RepID=A0A8R1TSG2_ONCVO